MANVRVRIAPYLPLKKVQLYPTPRQRAKLTHWFKAAETTFNNVWEYLRLQTRNGMPIPPVDTLRHKFLHSKADLEPWIIKTPIEIRRAVVDQVVQQFNVSAIWYPMLPVKSKRWKSGPSISILTEEPLCTSAPLPDKVRGEHIYVYRSVLQQFYLVFDPDVTPSREDNVVAFDPGVRTMLTGVSPLGYVIECMDPLPDTLETLMTWLHLYDIETVVYPSDFNIEALAANCLVYDPAKREAVIQFHQDFQRLLVEHQFNVVFVDEYMTTKICSNCGHLHRGIGSSRVFKCPNCRFELGRDVNAAMNILSRYLCDVSHEL